MKLKPSFSNHGVTGDFKTGALHSTQFLFKIRPGIYDFSNMEIKWDEECELTADVRINNSEGYCFQYIMNMPTLKGNNIKVDLDGLVVKSEEEPFMLTLTLRSEKVPKKISNIRLENVSRTFPEAVVFRYRAYKHTCSSEQKAICLFHQNRGHGKKLVKYIVYKDSEELHTVELNLSLDEEMCFKMNMPAENCTYTTVMVTSD